MTNKNLINYKAQRFQSELNKTTFAYEVKRVRALWDPTLSIPGTNRRGGWRCPVGTRYGGQITDRFGRNCGWGVARRIANAITNIGERMESLDDRRRGRRVDRRNRRMMGRLQQNAQAGRAERGLRGVADVLDGGEGADRVPRPPRGSEVVLDDVDVPEVSPVVLDDGGRPLDGRADRREARKRRRQERRERRLQERREREARGEPPAGQLGRGWRGVLSEGNRRYNEQGNRPWWGPGQPAPRPDADGVDVPTRPGRDTDADTPRPRRPRDEAGTDAPAPETPVDAEPSPKPARRPRRPKAPRDGEEARPRPGERKPPKVPAAGRVDPDTFPGTTGGPPGGEGREPGQIAVGRDGKYYKWVPNPDANLIGAGKQEKGFWVPASEVDIENDRLRKKERRVRGDDLRNPKPPKGAPDPEGKIRIWTDDEGDQWEYDPNTRQWNLRGNPRKRREAEARDRGERGGRGDAGEPQPPNRPPFDSDERDAGLRESERRRVRREIEEPGAERTATGETPEAEAPKPKKPRRQPNRRRAASDEIATESATRRPPAPGDKPAGGSKKPNERINLEEEMIEIAEGESMPDSRSFRNVNNRFPKSGLPKSAYWRKPDYDGDDAEQLEKRFGRYYDADNNINNRGRFVNKEIERRKREGGLTPKGRKPRKPKAEKTPKAPEVAPQGPVSNTPADQADIPSPPPMTATEEISPVFKDLPDDAKLKARQLFRVIMRGRDEEQKRQDKRVKDLIDNPLWNAANKAKMNEALEEQKRNEEFWQQQKSNARDNIEKLKRDYRADTYDALPKEAQDQYIDNVAAVMRADKEISQYRRRVRDLEEALDLRKPTNERRVRPDGRREFPTPPATPSPATPPAVVQPPAERSAPRAKQVPNVGPKAKVDNDNKLGQIDGGLPAGKAVPVGNRGIDTKEKAAQFVRDGGELRDVPDDFILDAMMANAQGTNARFTLSSVGGANNVNGEIKMFIDKKTGKQFLIKYATKGSMEENEDIYELLGNNIAGRMGLPVAEFRFAGPARRNVGNPYGQPSGMIRPILFEHSQNLVNGQLLSPKTENYPDEMAPQDLIVATMLDFAVINTDRHGGNFFLTRENGQLRFVQIDMSLGFAARSFSPNKNYADDKGFATWLTDMDGGGRNDMLSGLQRRARRGEISRADLVRELARVQSNLRAAERAKKYAEFGQEVYDARGAVTKIDQGVKHVDARLKYIMDADPARLADIILDPSQYK